MRTDRWTLLLVLAMALTAAYALASTNWTPGLGRVPAAALLSVFVTWLLARSRFGPRVSAFLAAAYGWAFLLWALLQDTPLEVELDSTWLSLHAQAWKGLARLAAFLHRATSGQSNDDLLIFTLLMIGLTWMLASFASWSAFRAGRFWPAFLPPGVGLLIAAYYYNGPVSLRTYVGVYVLLGLLLLARFALEEQAEAWKTRAVHFTGEVSYEFTKVGLLTALAILLVAWTAAGWNPVLALEPSTSVGRTWDATRETFTRLFGELHSSGPGPGDYYGSTLTLAGPIDLSNAPVLEVSASRASVAGRYYWRAVAYDQYQGGTWRTSAGVSQLFNPEVDMLQPEYISGRREVELTFTVLSPGLTRLYLASEPLWLDRGAWLETDPDHLGVISARASRLVPQGASYRERAGVLQVDQVTLRAAGTAYSQWIHDRFLQLPPEVTARTRALAGSIAGNLPTPYDQAEAITRYLRASIRYDPDIPSPPSGVEPVDWLLFDIQRGYCNYSASAEVILLRSLGVPARLAVGFSQGEARDPSQATYRVVEANAHAWPEVYFPHIGWVEFEPTTSQPVLERPAFRPTPEPVPSEGLLAGGPSSQPPNHIPENQLLGGGGSAGARGGPWRVLLVIPLAIAAAILGWAAVVFLRGGSPTAQAQFQFARLVRRRPSLSTRWPLLRPDLQAGAPGDFPGPLSAAERAYTWTGRLAEWIPVERGPYLTPLEQTALLKQRLPYLAPALETIAAAYVRERYGDPRRPQSGSTQEKARLMHALSSVRGEALTLFPGWLVARGVQGLRALRSRI